MMRTFQQIARAVAAAALITFSPVALLAQEREPLEPGARVRIEARTLSDTLLVGTVAFLERDILTLAPYRGRATLVDIPVSDIDMLEVSRGRASNWGYGALAGAAAGALAGLKVALGSNCWPVCELIPPVGAVLGALLGLSIGSEIETGPERWYEYPLPARAPAAP